MSFFWQHVGNLNAKRDLPRTIGTPNQGLKEFSSLDVRPHISGLSEVQKSDLERNFARIGKTKFQIWGLPTGAKPTLKNMQTGDYLMLLDSNADWGAFRYVGRVLYYLPGEQWELSDYLWKERRFPLVVLLRGALITYSWEKFLKDFGFGAGMKPMGRTYRISESAFNKGPSGTDKEFFEYLTENNAPYSDYFVTG